jgi:PKD repeat protein
MDGVTVTTVTLTVNTTGGTGAMSKLRIGTRSMFLAMLPFSMMGMLLINKRRGNLLVLLLVALCLAMGALGCGGGSSSSSSGALAPGGPYPVTVTATSNGATQTLTVGLTVNKQ